MEKKVGRRPDTVETELLQIPKDSHVLRKRFTLTADVMFANGVTLLTTLSRNISMFTAKHLKSCISPLASISLKKVAQL